ncbi:unnamed protein product, partial [Discosporangium mesarthrocarpum]
MAPYMEAVHYNGKGGFPSIAYDVTVDHTRRVLGEDAGFQGAMNNKTMIRLDKSITKIRSKDKYAQLEYTLVDAEGTEYVQRGASVIVDGGYHKAWRLTGFGIYVGAVSLNSEIGMTIGESARVSNPSSAELKCHWRILKLPLQFHTGEVNDEIFITCCTLQNMLHAWDGLDQLEGDGDWTGGNEMHD